MEKFVLSVLVENKAGVLSRVSGLFSRRGYNIDSLGQNLANLDIRLNTLKQKSWYNVAIGEGKENPSLL